MDPSVGALISALAQAAEQSRANQEQARRDHEQAMAMLVQGQSQFLERLGVTMASQMGAAGARDGTSSLIDPKGIGKPPQLTGKIAGDPLGF